MLAGHVDTTFDIDCVAQSVLDQKLDKASVFADGYTSLKRPEEAPAWGTGIAIRECNLRP